MTKKDSVLQKVEDKRQEFVTELLQYQGNRCARCGKELKEDYCVNVIDSNNPFILCPSCDEKYEREYKEFQSNFLGIPEFEIAAQYILAGLKKMGIPDDEANFKDTPKRLARAYYEIFEGVVDTDNKVKSILETAFPSDGHNDMVVDSNIIAFSMCPHHLLPVEYRVCVAYVPKKDGKVLGLSKLSRLVKLLAKQPMLQETYTQKIADYLFEGINAEGVGVRVVGRHMCMRMRGVKGSESSVTTSAVRGCFGEPECRQEFMQLAENNTRF